jgi:TRAP-type C4-dicarboxylate transport system substrate-binding protein
MKFRLSLFAALIAGVAFSTAQAQTKWDMPTPYADANFHTKNVVQFANDVKAASGGKLEIVVHSNASLIKHPEIKRAVQTGQVNIGQILISVLANEDPIFAFDSNPFLAPNYTKAKKLLRAARPFVEKRLEAQGIKVLFAVPWPPQGLYTKTPLNSTEDLKGVKFRTYSPVTSDFAKRMGAIPTTVQVPEIPQAFLTGLVDAMITSGATGVNTQAWDYLKYYTDTEAFLPFNMVIVNKAAFAKLDKGLQKQIMKAAAEAEKQGWATSEAENEGYKTTMASHGIKVQKPSKKLSAELNAIGKAMADDWAKKAGPDGQAILKKLK